MNKKVFISGSIAIKSLPHDVINSLQNIIQQNLTILVGDAHGIDTLIQNYCKVQGYNNVCVYSIYEQPRNLCSSNFTTKLVDVPQDVIKERERQTFKDSKMSQDSDYSFVIWDGKSNGSYQNILRAIEKNQKVKVYLSQKNGFLEQNTITNNEIEFIFRENNGYSAKEIVEYFANEGKEYFANTRQLNKFLLDKKIIEKQDKIYKPLIKKELFIIKNYKGKIAGMNFSNAFIDWIEHEMNNYYSYEQGSLFA